MNTARRHWLTWLLALIAATAVLVQFRTQVSAAHVVLAYLVLVLGASASGGRVLGLALSVLAFAGFNFFFVPPYHTFAVAARLDWLVLVAFLCTSVIAAQLLARAQTEASEARERADEVDRLALLGAEALNAGRAEDALTAVASVIRSSLALGRCEVHSLDAHGVLHLAAASGDALPVGGDPPPRRAPGLPDAANLLSWVATKGRPAASRLDGSLRFSDDGPAPAQLVALLSLTDASAILLPLMVRDRTVGVLSLLHVDAIEFDAARRRLLSALSYYAALGVERVRLSAEAEHAEALREADRLKDALLLSVSHDLRTPLTTIKALAHDLRASGDERAAIIEEESDRLNRFVADLLDLSRLAAGALSVKPEINAAEDLLGVALQQVAGAMGTRQIRVALDTSEPLLVGRFDFAHALRVLVNLIENAHKYSPLDQPIEVTARRDAGSPQWLDFVVDDRGHGVPDSEQDRIFEPFYRPSGSPPDAGSAGLGLSIARRLAEALGGTVFYVAREGGGSRFVLRVPAADVADLTA